MSRNRLYHHGTTVFSIITDEQGKILGYIVYELHKRRFEILRMAGAVTPLVKKMLSKLTLTRRTVLTYNCPEGNLEILNNLKEKGFKAVQLLRNYFTKAKEDAIRMRFRLEKEEKVTI